MISALATQDAATLAHAIQTVVAVFVRIKPRDNRVKGWRITGVGPWAYVGFFMKEELTLSGVKIVLYHKRHPYGREEVVIVDYHNDVSTEEAERMVKYLYDEGFISTDEISMEVVRRGYF